MTRVAVADLGTNSTRLLVADVDDGLVIEIERLLTITKLGEGVDGSGRLAPAAMARTLAALRGYDLVARELDVDARLAIATSAVREAANGRELLDRVEAEADFPATAVSGSVEAQLTFAGVTSGRPPLTGRTAVIDVGGGSTEIATGDADGLAAHVSLAAGCVRATERWLAEGPVDPDALAMARAALTEQFDREVPAVVTDGVTAGIAVAGTATTLAALDLGLDRYDPERIHGHRLTLAAAERWLARLAPLELAERIALPAMEAGRAPVIVGGVAVLLTAMRRVGLDAVEVSERDILHGIALAAATGEPVEL